MIWNLSNLTCVNNKILIPKTLDQISTISENSLEYQTQAKLQPYLSEIYLQIMLKFFTMG